MAFTKVVGPGIHTLAQLRTHNIHSAGIITATKFVGEMESGGGSSTFENVTVNGNLTVQGDTTTLNTTLRNVELLRVAADSGEPAGIITQTGAGDLLRLYDGTSQRVTVDDTGKVGIGTTVPTNQLHAVVDSSAATPLLLERTHNNNVTIQYKNSTSRMFAGLAGDALGWGVDDDENIGHEPMFIVRRDSGSVGIGTSNPLFPSGSGIEIHSTQNPRIKLSNSATGVTATDGTQLYLSTDGETILDNKDGKNIRIDTGGSQKFIIASDGNILPGSDNSQSIGTGTTNFASVWASTRFRGNDDVKLILGSSQDLVIRHDGSNNIIGSPQAGDLQIKSGTSDNDNQLISSFQHGTGSVGIGTTYSHGKLDISTVSSVNGATQWYGQNFGIVIRHSTGASPNDEGNGICFAQPYFTNDSNLIRTGAIIGYKQSANGSFGGGLIFKAQQNGANSLIEAFRISQEGNVGINRVNPNQRLNVGGNIEVNAYDNRNGQNGYYIQKGLIIGNAFDAEKLVGVNSITDDRNAIIWQERGLDLDFATSDTWRMKLTYEGKLGIGVTNPDTNLHVKGTGTDILKIESTATGAQGANLILHHNPGSGNMADNDVISLLQFNGVDDSNNNTTYASIRTETSDVSNNSETGYLRFYTRGLGAFNPILSMKNRGTAGANNYMNDDTNGLILDVYNTGNPYPRYINLIAKGAGDTDSNILFWTEKKGGNPTGKLIITADGEVGINQGVPTAELEVVGAGTTTISTIFINAATHNTNVKSEAVLKFGYGHSGDPDGVGHIKMVEDATNSFDADFIFGLPINNQSGGSVTNERVRITSEGQVRAQGTYNGSTSTSNNFPCLNINNLQGSYTGGNILGGVTFGKSPGHSSGIRAGMLALYSDTGSDSSNVGTDLVFRTASDTAGDSNEKLRISSDGNVTLGNASYGSSLGQLRIINDASSAPASIALFGHNNTNDGDAFAQIQFAEQESGTGGQIKAKIEAQAIATNERGADLVFFTAVNSASSTPTERVRIGHNGVFHVNSVAGGQAVVAFGDPEGDGFQDQNRIGGDTILVANDAISGAISTPRKGGFVMITAFKESNSLDGIYPQPNFSGMAYVDDGPSRNVFICNLTPNVGTDLSAKNSYDGDYSQSDDGKVTIMGGDTEGTFRIVNRANAEYRFQVTFL